MIVLDKYDSLELCTDPKDSILDSNENCQYFTPKYQGVIMKKENIIDANTYLK